MENLSLESRLQKCVSDYEQRLSIANDQVESLQQELQRFASNGQYITFCSQPLNPSFLRRFIDKAEFFHKF